MKVKAFLAVVMLAVAATANAQFSNASKSTATSSDVPSDYSSVYAEYNMNSAIVSGDGASVSNSGWNGFGVGYNYGKNISSGTPLYLEYGLAFNYLSKSQSTGGYKETVNIGTIKIPVNIAYRYTLPNSNISLSPYAGLYAKFNVFGNTKVSYEGQSASESIFEGDDAAKRFQVGFQVGANVDFGSAYVGLSYGRDITGLYSEGNYKWVFSTTSIKVGYNF